jgi:anti-sigma factor RsiW
MPKALSWSAPVICPAPESLVAHAAGREDPAVARHCADCPKCQAEVTRLREATGLLREQVLHEHRTLSPDCLDEAALAELLDERLDPRTRAPLIAHLSTCPRCRGLLKATTAALDDAAVASAVGPITRGTAPRRWVRWAVPLGAAAAIFLALLWPRNARRSGPTPDLREPALTSAVAPLAIAPRALVARVDRFVWFSVPGAERYRVRLYDDQGTVVWRGESTDTAVALPDSVRLRPFAPHFWRVEAETELQRWTASELVEFRLILPRP